MVELVAEEEFESVWKTKLLPALATEGVAAVYEDNLRSVEALCFRKDPQDRWQWDRRKMRVMFG